MSRFKTGKERRKRRRAYKRKVARKRKLATENGSQSEPISKGASP